MEAIRNKVLHFIALAAITAPAYAVLPYIQFRSAGRDAVDKVIGVSSHHSNLYGMQSYYGYFSARFAGGQNFRHHALNECLFGPALVSNATGTASDNDDAQDQIIVSGSAVANRGSNQLLADQFLLPSDFRSILTVKPRVRQFKVDFHFAMWLDEWVEGLYFRIFGPFVHTRNDLRFEENSITPGTATPTSNTSFANFAAGTGITAGANGSTVQQLQFAKITKEKQTRNEFGELRFELGYNFLLDEDYHLGLGLQLAAPTGKRPTGEFLFEPIGTNGKHWELGGVVTGHYTLWRSCDEEKHFDFVLEADITHLFKAKQTRTFDLQGKPLSRYMLAGQLEANTGDNVITGPAGEVIAQRLSGTVAPVANFSTIEVKSSFGVQADIVAMFSFTSCGFSLDLGYNGFFTSREKLTIRDEAAEAFNKNWALLGGAQTVGFNAAGDAIALSATNSAATIFTSGVTSNATTANVGIDTPVQALVGAAPLFNSTAANALFINTSSAPVAIKLQDLDLESARNKMQSHSIFTHLNYSFLNREDWVPFIGIGAQVEFGRHHHDDEDNNNNSTSTTTATVRHEDCALTKWSVWLKGGISFN